jgi:DNA-binding MarR family transcriptional regulator
VRRAADHGAGRRRDVILTARGREVAEQSFAALATAQGEIVAPAGKRRRDELARALDALLALFAGHGPR